MILMTYTKLYLDVKTFKKKKDFTQNIFKLMTVKR